MSATLWETHSHQVGELEEFRSEYEMEAFLMSNQVLLVGSTEEDEGPRRLWSQLPTLKGSGQRGRVDLLGLVANQGRYELKLFELKKSADREAVKQLRDYLAGWNTGSQDQKLARDYAQEFIQEFVDSTEARHLLNSLRGVLVASNFHEDALKEALRGTPRTAAVKLTKFRGATDTSYVFIEDLIGTAVQRRTDFSWADDGISESDTLVAVNVPGLADEISGRPYGPSVGASNQRPVPRKRIVLNEASTRAILKGTQEIERRLKEFAPTSDVALLNLVELEKNRETPLFLQNATALVFALADYRRQDFWLTPTRFWRLERTLETLLTIESRLRGAEKACLVRS